MACQDNGFGGKGMVSLILGACLTEFRPSFKMYFPLHLVLAMFKLPRLPDPLNFLENLMRSTSFLTLYVMSLFSLLFAHSKIVNGRPLKRWELYLWTWVGGGKGVVFLGGIFLICANKGLAVLLERPSRQGLVFVSFLLCFSHRVKKSGVGCVLFVSRLQLALQPFEVKRSGF